MYVYNPLLINSHPSSTNDHLYLRHRQSSLQTTYGNEIIKFSSVTEFTSQACLIIEIMTTALMRSNFGRTSLSSAGCGTMQQLKVDNFVPDGRVFHNDGPATEKLRGPKPTVLVLGTTRSPWPADLRWRSVDTDETGVTIDSGYGAAVRPVSLLTLACKTSYYGSCNFIIRVLLGRPTYVLFTYVLPSYLTLFMV